MTKKTQPLLAKLPADPAARLKLLVKFLSTWGSAPKKSNAFKKINAAKKRLGGMPKSLEVYYKLGIDRWLAARSKKFIGFLDEEWTWYPSDLLYVNWTLKMHVFGSAGIKTIAFGIRPHAMGEADPMIMTCFDGETWPFGTLSETIIRECILNLVGTAAKSRVHCEIGLQPDKHPLDLKALSLLSEVPVTDYRLGCVSIYEGADVLLVKRFPPGSKKCDLYLLGKKAADVKSFLQIDESATPKKTSKTNIKSLPQRQTTNVVALRKKLRSFVVGSSIEPATKVIAKAATPCIRLLDGGEFKRPAVGATRIGGDPDLPENLEWPTDPNAPEAKNALLFVGQINFKDLPTWSGSPFPKTGLLSLFVGLEGFHRSGCGFYFSSRKKIARRKTPKMQLVSDFSEPLKAMRVVPQLSLSIPAYVDGLHEAIVELCEGEEEFDRDYLCEDLRELDKGLRPRDCVGQIGGFAVPPTETEYHDEIACDQLKLKSGKRKAYGVSPIRDKRTKRRVYETALASQVLLSLDSSNSSGSMWSDSGILYMIQSGKALAERNFDCFAAKVYH